MKDQPLNKNQMRKKLIIPFVLFFSMISAQERDALLDGLFEEEMSMEQQLLPHKMIFTQSVLWGKNGLFRKTGISKLTLEQRQKELKVRNIMLKSHQIIGYLNLAGMVAQGIMGGKLYNGDYELYVQVEDEVGNKSGTREYRIHFTVINETSMTHFIPYPNPFSTSMRFALRALIRPIISSMKRR